MYILDDLEVIPNPMPDDDIALKEKHKKQKEDEFLCKGHMHSY